MRIKKTLLYKKELNERELLRHGGFPFLIEQVQEQREITNKTEEIKKREWKETRIGSQEEKKTGKEKNRSGIPGL